MAPGSGNEEVPRKEDLDELGIHVFDSVPALATRTSTR